MLYVSLFIITLMVFVIEEQTRVMSGVWFFLMYVTGYVLYVVLPYFLYRVSWLYMKRLHGIERRKNIKYYAGEWTHVN